MPHCKSCIRNEKRNRTKIKRSLLFLLQFKTKSNTILLLFYNALSKKNEKKNR